MVPEETAQGPQGSEKGLETAKASSLSPQRCDWEGHSKQRGSERTRPSADAPLLELDFTFYNSRTVGKALVFDPSYV